MPPRRPPREGLVVNNLLLFAAAILLLPWLVEAQQQRRPAVQQRQESPHEGNILEVTKIPPLETQLTHNRRKNTLSVRNNNINKNDVSALAPATAVAAPPARQSSTRTVGLTSPHIARSLEDWELEDFVLLATIDGRLHARDRVTGKEKWAFPFGSPMVETKYHRRKRSSVEEDYDPMSIDDYLWIVEPSRDGSLYIYRPSGPNAGLVNTGLTMKKLVENMVPYGGQDPPVVYNGEKKTQMVTIDAYTGKVLNYYGPQGAIVNEQCQVSNSRGDTDECPREATLTIGRTEYTVAIQGQNGRHVATLTFSEWSPNNYDQDLQRQHITSLDDQFIFPGHDGNFYGVDLSKRLNEDRAPRYIHKLPSPVVRVFDVAKTWGDKSDPELVILPQPAPPTIEDEMTTNRRASSIFLNHTEDGSWFAMSGKTYPWAVQGSRQARINQQGWTDHRPQWDVMNNDQLDEALVGLHSIEGVRLDTILTIGGSEPDNNQSGETFADNTPSLLEEPTWLQRLLLLPKLAVDSLLELIKNPIWIIVVALAVFFNQREIRSWVGRQANSKGLGGLLEHRKGTAMPSVDIHSEISKDEEIKPPVQPSTVVIEETPKLREQIYEGQDQEQPAEEIIAHKLEVPEEEKPPSSPEKEKKKAHRGRRGGVKHKKGQGRANSQGLSEDGAATPTPKATPKPVPTVEDAVRDAQNLGKQPNMEPDIVTVPTDPTEVSGPILRIGALEVNQEACIGIGSNGTMVFRGVFDGREVAVKRMMIQFFDIASQETKLLRESDDHPNVIRYFAQQQAAGFLYIALELCPASLGDVIDKPSLHRDLAQAGERDLPNVLYQITNGLQHLHKLRIVHRDLKPANILVAMGKDGKPRLLVSDFGLCKKLEGEQSSFRATTAHAAGTSGWRAPELLLDDDAKDNEAHKTMVDASTDGNSGSIVLNPDLLPNRRATRAIDIFSLGLVFYYVLTKGSHPFDCGDKYMREVNIRADKYDLEKLDVLGDYAFEARDLISSMLSHDPKQRPTAHQVMAHPFFWSPKKRLNFLCDVSDHFEKEKRDPPTQALEVLESCASSICGSDFLKPLSKEFVDSLGKQRKYTGTRLLDLLRALRNKKNHYEDMSDKLKSHVGTLPEGYLNFWTRKFPALLITCWNIVYEVEWDLSDRFREYYVPAIL